MDETDRRRAVQHAHNTLNGITPTAVSSNGAGSALMLQTLEEAKRRRKGRAAAGGDEEEDEDGAARGADAGDGRSGLYAEPATRAPPRWLGRVEPSGGTFSTLEGDDEEEGVRAVRVQEGGGNATGFAA